jgi:hypothetical protein
VTVRPKVAALSALALGVLGACGAADGGQTKEHAAQGPVITYSREGGIRFQASKLTVSQQGVATLEAEGCRARFPLAGTTWRRLQEVLEKTDMEALAGDYPPSPGSADVISEEIVIGPDVVRIGDFTSLPRGTHEALSPLMSVLGQALGESGKRC